MRQRSGSGKAETQAILIHPLSMPTEGPSFALEITTEHHRNPYVVLGIEPVFEADMWDTLTELGKRAHTIQERLTEKKWLAFDAMPDDERLRAWKATLAKAMGQEVKSDDEITGTDHERDLLWKALLAKTGEKVSVVEMTGTATEKGKDEDVIALETEMKDSNENRRAKQTLPLLIVHYQHFLAARQEGERVDARERALLAECQMHLAALSPQHAATVDLMPREETLEQPVTDADGTQRVNRVTVFPQIADIRAWAMRLQAALTPAPAEEKAKRKGAARSKKKKSAQTTVLPADDVAAKLATQAEMEQARTELRSYEDLRLQAYQLADILLHVDDALQTRYRELSRESHPDRNPGDGRAPMYFKEVDYAYAQLVNATLEERMKFARDMVFGQNTGMWTDEMRRMTDGVMKLLAVVFAAQEIRGMDPAIEQRCPACVDGVVVMQQANDYIPVPLVCGQCRGSGVVNKAVFELREALRTTTKKKKDT